MRACVLAISLIASTAFASEMVASNGDDSVRISDSPCLYAAVLQHIKPEDRKAYRKAGARVEGKTYFACWRISGNAVHLIYEDADQGIIPVHLFKEVPSV